LKLGEECNGGHRSPSSHHNHRQQQQHQPQPQPHHHHHNCTVSSETQSLSVKSIKEPTTGGGLPPPEAIKRKLLDPYQGVYVHPVSGERLAISDAIQKGLVQVEMLVDTPSTGPDHSYSSIASSGNYYYYN